MGEHAQKNMKTAYIFGYGSLIEANSRAKTGSVGKGFPVRVHGVRRAWCQSSAKAQMTTVGIDFQEGSACNGVLFPILSHELPLFDQREAHYHRKLLPSASVEFLENPPPHSSHIWTYVPKRAALPSPTCPLVQSYIDVCLSGCLAISEDFAEEFIETTALWSVHWLNDRHQPRYQRFMQTVPLQEKIDALLEQKQVLPHFLEHSQSG